MCGAMVAFTIIPRVRNSIATLQPVDEQPQLVAHVIEGGSFDDGGAGWQVLGKE